MAKPISPRQHGLIDRILLGAQDLTDRSAKK